MPHERATNDPHIGTSHVTSLGLDRQIALACASYALGYLMNQSTDSVCSNIVATALVPGYPEFLRYLFESPVCP